MSILIYWSLLGNAWRKLCLTRGRLLRSYRYTAHDFNDERCATNGDEAVRWAIRWFFATTNRWPRQREWNPTYVCDDSIATLRAGALGQ